jgi:dTDP-4-amino-4,6-dideoxygalactose transaminase
MLADVEKPLKSVIYALIHELPGIYRMNRTIPVMRPRLPNTDQLLPYLRRIDATRVYSNFGPLTIEFQNRLSDHFGVSRECVAAASCGTTALIGAILAAAGPATQKRPYALIPAFTFAATAVAVERCGYQTYFADIDINNWMLDPQQLLNHRLLDQIGVVVPVAPFGRPISQVPWQTFQKRTGVPVVIDAAASFDCLVDSQVQFIGEIPVVLSFHATKSFGTGEGGCVVSTDTLLIRHAMQALNFGFYGTRDSACASLNGKMSEYHAAVGLAELDGWTAKQAGLEAAVEHYRQALSNTGLISRFFSRPDISACYALFSCRDHLEANFVQSEFERDGIEFRLWYGTGLHHHTHFLDRPRDNLDITEDIANRMIGLPMAPDLSSEDVKRVTAALSRG